MIKQFFRACSCRYFGTWGRLAVVLVCTSTVISEHARAGVICLPDPVPVQNSLTFGDFTVFSLAFLNNKAGFGTPNGSDPYNVQSSPGQVAQNDFVIATGPTGNVRDNGSPNVDNAWGTYNSNDPMDAGINRYTFGTYMGSGSSFPDPTPSFTNDNPGTWDALASEITARIGDHELVFFFNLNEVGTESELGGEDLLAWAQVDLFSPSDLVTPQHTYILNGTNTLVPGQGPISKYNRDDWAYVHSTITVDKDTGDLLKLGPNNGLFPNGKEISQNLGADNAAFAAYNADLSQMVRDNPTWILRAQLELGDINNGYEQLFIRGAKVEGDLTVIPEPASMVTWAIFGGSLAIPAVRKRRASRKKAV